LDREKELLRQARRWEKDALAEIYDSYSTEIYRYAVGQLGDRDLAEECVGETFHRFLRALHNGSGPHRYLRAYLYRIAHNWVIDQLRLEPSLALDGDIEDERQAEPVGIVVEQDSLERTREALTQLTTDQRQVVVLRYIEGWSQKEIARALQRSVGAIKALQHRALVALRRMLVEREE